jgi:hypothetical protein
VKHSLVLRWSLLILLPLTIAWKLAAKPENPIEVQDAIVEFLAGQKFNVALTGDVVQHGPIFEATSDSCRLRVAAISPLGDEVNLIQSLAATTDHVFFVFRKTIYTQQPILLGVMNYLWFRFLRELGLVSRIPPLLAVVSSCDAERLPWSTLNS